MLQNSTETLQQLEAAFDEVKKKLFTELHQIVREQIFPPEQKTTLQLPAEATYVESASKLVDPKQNGVLSATMEGTSSE